MLSITIVTWNSSKFIPLCIPSILEQRDVEYELIIIDNNSDDREVKLIKEFNDPRIKIINNKTNVGFSKGHNIGINQSRGDWVFVLNIDTILEKDYLKKVFNYCTGLPPDVGCVGTRVINANDRTKIDSDGIAITKQRHFYDVHQGVAVNNDNLNSDDNKIIGVCACGVFYKREMINQISYNNEFFDETFESYYEDVDIAWRAFNHGWDFRILHDPVLFHFRGGTWNRSTRNRVRYYLVRNRYFTMIKNDKISSVLMHLPFILQIEIINLLRILRWPVILKIYKDVFINFNKMIGRRKVNKKKAIDFSSSKDFNRIYLDPKNWFNAITSIF